MLDSADSAFFSWFKHHVQELFCRIILEINVKNKTDGSHLVLISLKQVKRDLSAPPIKDTRHSVNMAEAVVWGGHPV